MKTSRILNFVFFLSTFLFQAPAGAQLTDWDYGDITPYPDPKLWAIPKYGEAERAFKEGRMPSAEDLEKLQGFYTFEECLRPAFVFKNEFFALLKTPTQVAEENAKFGVELQTHYMGFFGPQDSNIGQSLKSNPERVKIQGLLEYLKELYRHEPFPDLTQEEFTERTGVKPVFYSARNTWGNAQIGVAQAKPKFERGSYRLPNAYPPIEGLFGKEIRIHTDGSLLLKLDLQASKDHIYCVRPLPIKGVSL